MWAAKRGGAEGDYWVGVVGCVSLYGSQWACVLSFSERRAFALTIRIRANMGVANSPSLFALSIMFPRGE